MRQPTPRRSPVLISMCLLLAAGVLGLRVQHVHADTLRVCKSGCIYPTIWGAVNDAQPGDIVEVEEGRYDEPQPLLPRAGVVVRAVGRRDRTIITMSGSGSIIRLTGLRDDPPRVITGFTIVASPDPAHGAPTDRGGAIYIGNRASPIIAGNVFSNCIASQRGGAIVIEEADTRPAIIDNEFLNCTVEGSNPMGGGALCVLEASPTIRGNTFVNNASDKHGGAIYVENPRNPVPAQEIIITDNRFEGNIARRGSGGAICVEGSRVLLQGNIVVSNSAYYNGGGIYTLAASASIQNNSILSNTAMGGGGGGMNLNEVRNTTVVSNTIAYNRALGGNIYGLGGGISILNATLVTVDRNVVHHNRATRGEGVYIEKSALTAVTFINNVLSDNGQQEFAVKNAAPHIVNNTIVGTGTTSNSVGIDLHDASRPVIVNNIVAWEQVGMQADISSTVTVRYNDLWGNQTHYQGIVPDASNMSLNPQFVDTLHADYHLKAGSPLIDAGSNADAPDHDMDGDRRPVDGNGDGVAIADIGADEYEPGSATETPTPTPTGTPTGTPTPTATATEPTPTPTPTWTPGPTSTPTATLTPTSMRTASPTPTRTGTPTSPVFHVYLPSILAPATEAVLHHRKAGESAGRLAGW